MTEHPRAQHSGDDEPTSPASEKRVGLELDLPETRVGLELDLPSEAQAGGADGTTSGPEQSTGAPRPALIEVDVYPEVEAEGGWPDGNGVYPSGKTYREIFPTQNDSEVAPESAPITPQELAHAHEVAKRVDSLETARAKELGKIASLGKSYEVGAVSKRVFNNRANEVEHALKGSDGSGGLNAELNAKYEEAEAEVTAAEAAQAKESRRREEVAARLNTLRDRSER